MNTHNFLAPWRGYAALISVFVAMAVLPPAATAATVTYSDSSCTSFAVSGTPPNQTVTCVTAGGGTPVCAPTANPASPLAGQQTTISANCSNQPTANSYVWTDSSASTACTSLTGPTCDVMKSRARTVTYTVKASNAAGAGLPATIDVTWR